MPTTRRSSSGRGRSAIETGKQSKLTFNNRVTKPVAKSAKKADTAAPSPLKKELIREHIEHEDPILQEAEESSVETETTTPAAAAGNSDFELKASKLSDAAVNRYWGGVEAERMAKRVHLEDLTTSEKVLRYFDVSSHYGPCIGITRLKRWQRAQRLGLNPPIEVLAVLLKEEAKGNHGIEKAHVDTIMNSTVVA